MKVSIEGILGSARKINSQRNIDDDNLNKNKKEIKSDSIAINKRIDSRLEAIGKEFRDIQTSLTKNQIVYDGINQLENDLAHGGKNSAEILQNTTFNQKTVLEEVTGKGLSEELLKQKKSEVGSLINDDVAKIKKLQVELDNIQASNLVDSEKMNNVLTNVNSIFDNVKNVNAISQLRPDAVMKLIQ